MFALDTAYTKAKFNDPNDMFAYLFNSFNNWFILFFLSNKTDQQPTLYEKQPIPICMYNIEKMLERLRSCLYKQHNAFISNKEDKILSKFKIWYNNKFIYKISNDDSKNTIKNSERFHNEATIWQAMWLVSTVLTNLNTKNMCNGAAESLAKFDDWYQDAILNTSLKPTHPSRPETPKRKTVIPTPK
jgi:hypothetical protein